MHQRDARTSPAPAGRSSSRRRPRGRAGWLGLALAMALIGLPGAAGAQTMAEPTMAQPTTTELTLNLTGLEDLGSGSAYEGWLIENGMPVSTGTFTVDSSGTLSRTTFPVTIGDMSKVSAFVLTIEPSPDPDPMPSVVHLLAGDLMHGTAHLSTGHSMALGTDFGGANGRYILAAPSIPDSAAYRMGIWWVDPAGPAPSLTLPILPTGWVYEGWVVGPNGPITTGRFTRVNEADFDGAGPTAGPRPELAPPFPGQDFASPPISLPDGYMAVITVEPQPDNSPMPFSIKPLVDMDIQDIGPMVLQEMDLDQQSLPSGTAMLGSGDMSGGMMMDGMAGATVARDGRTLAAEPAETQALFRAIWGDQAAMRWVQEHNAMLQSMTGR